MCLKMDRFVKIVVLRFFDVYYGFDSNHPLEQFLSLTILKL